MSVPYYGDFAEDDTVNIPFNTFDSNDPSASVTITNLADADIHVHKDAHVDEIATDGATVVINFDGITGNHMINIDTSVDAAYATGSEYQVRIEGTTVDGGTINAFVGSFSIERAGGALALIKTLTTEMAKVPKSDSTVSWNATALAAIEAEALDALQGVQLDHLCGVTTGVAADGDLTTYAVDGSIMSHLLSTAANTSDFKASTESLQAIRDNTGSAVGASISADIADLPTVAEFEARTIVSADYVVVGDTLARVTLVDTVTTNTDLVSAADVKTAMEADAGDLSSLMEALVNKLVIEEATGTSEMFNDAGVSQGTVVAAFTTDGTYTTRLRMFK